MKLRILINLKVLEVLKVRTNELVTNLSQLELITCDEHRDRTLFCSLAVGCGPQGRPCGPQTTVREQSEESVLGFYVAYRGKNQKFCPIRTRCADRTFWDNRTSNRSSRVGSTHDSQNRSETQVCKTSDLRYNNSMSYGKHIRPQIAPINSTPLIPKSG